MNTEGKEITYPELFHMTIQAMWVGSRRNMPKGIMLEGRIVLYVQMSDGQLMIRFIKHDLSIRNPKLFLINPWTIDICREVLRKQKRKAVDGGGWHEVLVTEVVLRLTNHAIMEREEKKKSEEHLKQRQVRSGSRSSRTALLLAATVMAAGGSGAGEPPLESNLRTANRQPWRRK